MPYFRIKINSTSKLHSQVGYKLLCWVKRDKIFFKSLSHKFIFKTYPAEPLPPDTFVPDGM